MQESAQVVQGPNVSLAENLSGLEMAKVKVTTAGSWISSGHQTWQWTFPPFINDFPIQSYICKEVPTMFDYQRENPRKLDCKFPLPHETSPWNIWMFEGYQFPTWMDDRPSANRWCEPGIRIPSAFGIFWGEGRVMEDLLAVRTSFGHRFLGPGPELWRHLWKMDPNTVNPLRSHILTHTHSSQIAHCGNICI